MPLLLRKTQTVADCTIGRPRAYPLPRLSGRTDASGRAHTLSASKTVRFLRRGGLKKRSDLRISGAGASGVFAHAPGARNPSS